MSAPAEAAAVNPALEEAISAADRVLKRQKTSAARTSGTLYKAIHTLEQALQRLSADPSADPAAAVAEVTAALDALDAVAAISTDTKDIHGAVSKLGKIIDRDFSTDICAAMRPVAMDRGTLDRVIAEHLYQEGAFEAGDAFVAEAGLQGGDALKAPYASMHAVLERLAARELGPAMAWAAQHRARLRNSTFEFSLHRLAFLQALEREGRTTALGYARKHLAPYAAAAGGGAHLKDIQRLMGALAFHGRRFKGPYADLLGGEALWEDLALQFQRQCCALMGQAEDSPLLVTVAAGAAALPTLLKLASVMSKTNQPAAAELNGGGGDAGELPVEVELGKEFVFHSIFACPVSREQSSAENPPMMLPCGHCLSKLSVMRVAKSATRAFKCPYCPREATLQQCMELKFPDRK